MLTGLSGALSACLDDAHRHPSHLQGHSTALGRIQCLGRRGRHIRVYLWVPATIPVRGGRVSSRVVGFCPMSILANGYTRVIVEGWRDGAAHSHDSRGEMGQGGRDGVAHSYDSGVSSGKDGRASEDVLDRRGGTRRGDGRGSMPVHARVGDTHACTNVRQRSEREWATRRPRDTRQCGALSRHAFSCSNVWWSRFLYGCRKGTWKDGRKWVPGWK